MSFVIAHGYYRLCSDLAQWLRRSYPILPDIWYARRAADLCAVSSFDEVGMPSVPESADPPWADNRIPDWRSNLGKGSLSRHRPVSRPTG